MIVEKKCEECGKEFEAQKTNAKYCSSTCRSRASIRRNLGASPGTSTGPDTDQEKETPAIQRSSIPTLAPGSGLEASQFIISLLQKEADRFETAYNKERDTTRELRKKNEDLAEKIRQADMDKKIAEAKGPERSSLQGLMESPVMQGLIPFLGPAIQEGASALVKKIHAAPVPAAGVNGLDENSPIGQFMIWLASKPQDVQEYVLQVIQGFMQISGDVELMQRLIQVRDFVVGQGQYMRAS